MSDIYNTIKFNEEYYEVLLNIEVKKDGTYTIIFHDMYIDTVKTSYSDRVTHIYFKINNYTSLYETKRCYLLADHKLKILINKEVAENINLAIKLDKTFLFRTTHYIVMNKGLSDENSSSDDEDQCCSICSCDNSEKEDTYQIICGCEEILDDNDGREKCCCGKGFCIYNSETIKKLIDSDPNNDSNFGKGCFEETDFCCCGGKFSSSDSDEDL